MLRRLVLLTFLMAISIPSAQAQTDVCDENSSFEPAAETQRTVELPDFGIAVAIPSNYRTMKLQDGSVSILHPDDFALRQCVAQGGYGARGYYSETIQQVAPDPSMPLRDQAIWSVGYQLDSAGRRMPAYAQIRAYDQNGFSGYLVQSLSDYSATFLGTYPNSEQLLQVTAGCDCSVEIQNVVDVLSTMTLLD